MMIDRALWSPGRKVKRLTAFTGRSMALRSSIREKALDVSAQLLIVQVASYRRFMAVKRWLLP